MSLRSLQDPVPMASLVASIYNRIANLLPIQTGYSVAQVEMDPFFLASRKPLVGTGSTALIADIIKCSCDILDDINRNDESLPTTQRSDLSLKSILIIVRLLADLTEANWAFHEPESIRTGRPIDFVSNSNIVTGTGEGASSLHFHTVQPSPIPRSVIERAIRVIALLKSDTQFEREVAKISESVYYQEHHPYRSLIDHIDQNCDAVLRYFAATNVKEYSEYIVANLHKMKSNPNKEYQYLSHSALMEFCFLDDKSGLQYIKDIWHSFAFIKKPLYQQLLVAFFVNGIKHCGIARPRNYLIDIHVNAELATELDAFIDYLYTQFEGTKYARATYRSISILMACYPKGFEDYLNKSARLRPSFAKKLKFFNHITRNLTGNRPEDFECLITLMSFASVAYDLDPNHPIVKFALFHFDTAYKGMKSNLSINVSRGKEDETRYMHDLRVEFYCSVTILRPDIVMTEMVNFIKRNQNDIKIITLAVAVVRSIGEMPTARKYFNDYMKQLSETLKIIMITASRIIQEHSASISRETSGSSSTETESTSTPTTAVPSTVNVTNNATSPTSSSRPALGSISASFSLHRHHSHGPAKHEDPVYSPVSGLGASNTAQSNTTNSSLQSSVSQNVDESNKTDTSKKASKLPKVSEAASEFYKRRNTPIFYAKDILCDIFHIFSYNPYLYFNDQEALNGITDPSELYDIISANVRGISEPLLVSFRDEESKLSDSAAKFSMRLMDKEFIAKDVQYVATSYVGTGYILLSICNALTEYSLTNTKIKKLYTFMIQFFEARDKVISSYPTDGLVSKFKTHDNRTCQAVIQAIEKTFLIALCAPDIEMYRLTKRGIKMFLKERIITGHHHSHCFGSGSTSLFNLVSNDTHIVTGLVALHKRIRKFFKTVQPSKGVKEAWILIYDRWLMLSIKDILDPNEKVEFRNYGGFLASVCGCFLKTTNSADCAEVDEALFNQISEFVRKEVSLLSSDDLHTRENSRDVLANEMHPTAFTLVIQQLTEIIDSIKYKKEEIVEADLVLVEQVIVILGTYAEADTHDVYFILHGYLKPVGSIYGIIARLTESLRVLKLKIRFCKMGAIIDSRKSEVGYEGALRIRNKNIKALCHWLELAVFPEKEDNSEKPPTTQAIFPFSVQKNEQKVAGLSYIQLDLAIEASKLLSLKLESLPLESPQSLNEHELKRSKDIAFANVFSLLYRILEKFNSSSSPVGLDNISKHKVSLITDNIILCLSNLLRSNVEVGLKYALPLGINEDKRIRVSLLQVFANIIDNMGATFNSDKEADEVSLLDQACETLVKNIDVCVAMADSSPTADIDSLASSLLSMFGYYGSMKDIIDILITNEISSLTRSVDILRRNSVITRMLALFANRHGHEYLLETLKPIIEKLNNSETIFEIEKLTVDDSNGIENLDLFMEYLTEIVSAITSSVSMVSPEFRYICSTIYKTVITRFPGSGAIAVGAFMFLRFFCPAIVNPETSGILAKIPDRRVKRSLIQLAKVIQNMANGSLSSLRWPLLSSRAAKLASLNKSILDFLEVISSPTQPAFLDKIEEKPIGDIHFIHRFLYENWLDVRKHYLVDTDSSHSDDERAEHKMKVFTEIDHFVGRLGQPKASFGFEIPDSIKNNDTNNALFEFMSKYSRQDVEQFTESPIVQGSIFKDGTPVIVLNLHYVALTNASPELVVFRMFHFFAAKFLDSKFYLIVDCSGFHSEISVASDVLKLINIYCPEAILKNCLRIYYFNISSKYFPAVIDDIRVGSAAKIFNSLYTEFFFYSSMDDIRILNQLTLCDYSTKVLKDSRVVFNDVMLYQSEGDRPTPVTVKVGSQFVQVISNNPQKVKVGNLLKNVKLNDIYHISEISNAVLSNSLGVPNELSFTIGDERKVVMTSTKKIEIMRTIYFASSRFSQADFDGSNRDGSDVESDKDGWIGELINVGFGGLLSDNENIRATAFKLLGSLSSWLDLKLGGAIESAYTSTFPQDNTAFVISVSHIMASKYAEKTYEFLKGYFACYEKLSKEQKLSAVMYVSPWINNIYTHVFAADEEGGPERTAELINEFCRISILDGDLLPSFNNFVWNKLCLEDRISSVLLDEIVSIAIDRKSEGSNWDCVITLVSLTPTVEICGQVVHRLKEIIHIPKSEGESSMITHGSWVEITVLIKICVALFFNSIIFAEMFLPDILFISTVFIDMGPLELRSNLQKLLNNVVHSFLGKENLSDTQKESIVSVLDKIGGQRAKMIFGLTRENEDKVVSDSNQITNSVTGLEIFCDILIDLIGKIGDANSRAIWRVRWNASVIDAVFREDSILQARSLLILGFLTKSGASDTLASRITRISSEISAQDIADPKTLKLAVSSLYAMSRLVEGLEKDSVFFTKFFWLAVSTVALDNVVLYQASLQFVGRTMESMIKNERFIGGDVLDIVFEERKMFGKTMERLEEIHGFIITRDNFDSVLTFLICKGLMLPHSKHVAIEVLQSCFKIRCLNERVNYYGGKEVNYSCYSYLTFIYILAQNQQEFDKYLSDFVFEEFVDLGNETSIPFLLLEFLLSGSSEAISTLYQASLFFHSPGADEASRLRYLYLYHYLGKLNPELFFMVYDEIRPTLRDIASSSSSLPLLSAVYEVVTETTVSPLYGQLSRFVSKLDKSLEAHKISGFKKGYFLNHNTGDDIVSGLNKERTEIAFESARCIRHLIGRIVSSYVETE